MTIFADPRLETTQRWSLFERFLMLGNERGVYTTPSPDMRDTATPALSECLQDDGLRAVREAAGLLTSGKAYRPEPALYVLAQAIAVGAPDVRKEALEAIPMAVRSSAQLYQLCRFLKGKTGWGRGLRAAISAWYGQRTTTELVYQVIRAPYDRGWSHRDILRLAHPKPPTEAHDAVYRWISTGSFNGRTDGDRGLEMLAAYLQLSQVQSGATVRSLIAGWPALRETIPGQWLRQAETWNVLLPSLSSEALIRWIPQMIAHDMLHRGSPVYGFLLERLRDTAFMGRGNMQPFVLMSAWARYRSHAAMQGATPAAELERALSDAYHQRLVSRTPGGGTVVVAIDPTASTALDGLPAVPGLSPRMALTALALNAVSSAGEVYLLGFGSGMTRLSLAPGVGLDTLSSLVDGLGAGAPDATSPIAWALEQSVDADAFLVLSGTRPNPAPLDVERALQSYRATSGMASRWIAVNLAAERLWAPGAEDSGMVEVHGFDATVPGLLDEWLRLPR